MAIWIKKLLDAALLGFVSMAYCTLIWFASGALQLVVPDIELMPRMTAIAFSSFGNMPWHVLHWQLIVLVSYGLYVYRSYRAVTYADSLAAAFQHSALVFCLTLWQAASALMPFVIVSYVLE